MKPLHGNIILKEIPEKKTFKGIIIPQQAAVNQITFAKVIALPDEPLDTKNLNVGDYVALGYSPVWGKKYKHHINDEDYLIINEYAILAIIKDAELMDLIDAEDLTNANI